MLFSRPTPLCLITLFFALSMPLAALPDSSGEKDNEKKTKPEKQNKKTLSKYRSLPEKEREKIRKIHENYNKMSPEKQRKLREKWKKQKNKKSK